MTEKRCSKCGETKPLEEFPRSPTCLDGRRGACKSCARGYDRERRTKNRDRIAAVKRRHYEANREAILASNRAWIEANRERRAESMSRYQKERYATDPAYRLQQSIRNTLGHARRKLARSIQRAEEMYL